jgi:hypothetical protein
MGVRTACHRLAIGDNGAQRREIATLLLWGDRIEEGIKLWVEAGLSGQQIAQEKVIDNRLMAEVPANAATFWRRAPLHVGFGEISIQTLRIAPRSIVLVTKHLKVHGSPLAPMSPQSPFC